MSQGRQPLPESAPWRNIYLSGALAFKRMIMGLTTAADLMGDGALVVDGNLEALATLGRLFDRFERRFPIVTPRPAP